MTSRKRPGAPAKPGKATRAGAKPAATPAVKAPPLVLSEVRERIDGIDRQIQGLIAERARWAQQVGKAKGPLKAAVDYYRPER
nr:chorismate mutase [Arenimonas sp.]